MAMRTTGVMEQDPVREFTGDHETLARTLLNRLVRERQVIADKLATVDAKDFSEYRNWRGQIDGLDIAINFCKEAQRKLQA